jgi:hypothetical protein
MSMARDMAMAGQTATAVFEEDDAKNLRTGKTFRAKIEPLADLELNTELGRDPRASHWFHILDRTVDMAAGDEVTALGARFKILPAAAPDNAASLHLKYLAMQLTVKDN